MPNPINGCLGLKNVFVDHIYSEVANPWRLIAAISGAHTLGSANKDTSGFDGMWGVAE